MRRRWVDRLRRLAIPALAAGCALGTAACAPVGGLAAAQAAQAASSAPAPPTYLALGDSVPFGFRAGSSGADYRNEASFAGYPALVGRDLGLRLVDASCPGETSASFLDVSAPSNGCENQPQLAVGYRSAFPLHTVYDTAGQSQMDLAVATLTRTRDVSLVTVQVGANDAFLCQRTTADHCAAPAEQQAMAERVRTNLGRILSTLRGAGHYGGRVVVVTYYALDYTGAEAAGTQALDRAMTEAAQAHGAAVADGYAAFRAAAEKAGGSSVDAGLVLPHDVHPTAAGQASLAAAVEAVVAHGSAPGR